MFPSSQYRFWLMATAVLVAFLLLVIATAVTKAPTGDEGWFASPAYNLAFKGFMGTTVLDPGSGTPVLHTRTRLDGIDRYTYWVMPLNLITQAGWYKLVGFGMLRMRALSIIWALVALVSWWMVFSQLSGNRYTALLAVALFEVEYLFVWAAADGRMDIQCAALGAAGLAAYMRLRQRSMAWALLAANVLLAASGLTHPNGDLYFVALVCLVLMYDHDRLQWRYLVISGFPYIVGAALWAPYILKAPDLFKVQLLGNMVGRESAFSAPLSTLQREVKRYLDAFGFAAWSKGFAHLSILELLSFLGGVVACATYGPLRRKSASRRVVVITGAVCLFLWLFEGAKVSSYLLHVLPWFCLALAFATADCWNERGGPRMVAIAVVGMVFLLAVVRITVPAMRDNYHQRYLPAAQYLARNAAPSDLIMGSAELALYLGFDWHVLDDIMMGTTTGKSARFIVVDRRYSDYMQSIRVTAPAEFERVGRQLSEQYNKVYDQSGYQIYRRVH
jgi:hypothetical protein